MNGQMTIFDFIKPTLTDLEAVLCQYDSPIGVIGGREAVIAEYRKGGGGAQYLQKAYAPHGYSGGTMPGKKDWHCSIQGIVIETYSHSIPGKDVPDHIYERKLYSWIEADKVVRAAIADGRYT